MKREPLDNQFNVSLLFSLQQITDLKKENFNLKLRIYFMEERMQQRLGDGDDVFKIVRCTTKSLSNKFLKSRQMVERKHLNLLKTFILYNTMSLTVPLMNTKFPNHLSYDLCYLFLRGRKMILKLSFSHLHPVQVIFSKFLISGSSFLI